MSRCLLRYILFSGLLLQSFMGAAELTYKISFPNPNTHYIRVDIEIPAIQSDSFDIKMPVWIPGSYMIREFSRHVEGFNVQTMEGNTLKFTKVRKNAWRIYNSDQKQVRISYLVYAYDLSVRTNFVNDEFAFMNGAALFMYVDQLKLLPADVIIVPDDSWKVISAALPVKGTDKWIRRAENFDKLADSPIAIGNQDVISFDYKGIAHHVVMLGKANYDSVKIKKDFYDLVAACTGIFGENPNKDYTFFIINSTTGGGGLEHSNASTLMTARTSYDSEAGYRGLLSLATHEYFHLWNVKRIRPIELGPFDYENEVYTHQIWFFEGITSYYDDYFVYKSGFSTESDYLEVIKNSIQSLENTPGSYIQSLSEASFDAWIKYYRQNENSKNSIVSYYSKGAMVGAMLNLDIMNNTKNEKSLDDVLRYLYQTYYKKLNRGLTDRELQSAFEIVAGKNYDDFFNKYISGTDRIPYEEYLLYAGLQLQRKDGMKASAGYLGATFNQQGNKVTVSYVERNSSAWAQGLNVNDEIISIDDIEPALIKDYLGTKQPGDTISIKLVRFGLPKTVSITLGESTIVEYELSKVRKPTPLQEKIYTKWLGREEGK